MWLPQTEHEFRNALIDAAEVGAAKALTEAGILKPFLKLSEAKKLYGAAIVNRWIQEDLIRPIKDGDRNASVRLDRIELLTIAKTCNRATYLTTEERSKKDNH